MPGFNIAGGGHIDQKDSQAEPRRKHRWLVSEITSPAGNILGPGQLVYLEKAARPQFKYEMAEMHHDQEVAYFAGKQLWEPITLVWYDVEQPADVTQALSDWLSTITRSWQDPAALTQVATPSEYKSTMLLEMRDGDGVATEQWNVFNAWPEQTNFGELDYTSSDIVRVEITLRYDKAVKL